MSEQSKAPGVRRGGAPAALLPPSALAGFLIAAAAVLLTSYLSYTALRERTASAARVAQTLGVQRNLEALLASARDAETGQRGFLLTGNESYVEPFTAARAALPGEFARLREVLAGNAEQLARLDALERASTEKIEELAETIELRRAGNTAAALALVRTDRGKVLMDNIRTLVDGMRSEEQRLLGLRQRDFQEAANLSFYVTGGGSALLLVLIGLAALTTSRSYREREAEAWMRVGQARLAERMQGDRRLDQLGDKALAFLAAYLDAPVGALYIHDGASGGFQRIAGYACASAGGEPVRTGDGLVGQAAKENRSLHVHEVPAGYLPITSGVGRGDPRELLLVPASTDGDVQAVIEFGFLRAIGDVERDFLARVSGSLAVAVRSSKDRSRLEELLMETQQQSEELQTQQEELRVTNEELEEQARALKESQTRLESQQAELEANNAQLEEQTQLLEHQKDALTRSESTLTEKAGELERSSQYKSEFLANMSHELRTPLNSTLILAKLLADNREGNLNPEQVKFAQTISSAGNDLLVLINDILDLSKIEAGAVEVQPEEIEVAKTAESIARGLEPVAAQKGLQMRVIVEPGTPPRMQTDPQRLAQIIKNLLSNAIKFTARGEVTLRVFSGAAGKLSFAVRDTGIGIPEHQQGLIFEAFRQADGSTHRKYGGTGLGLSISRDLAHLLGGEIAVKSAEGAGSVFTLTLPAVYAGAAARPPAAPRAAEAEPRAPQAPQTSPHPSPQKAPRAAASTTIAIDDDRDQLKPGARLILVVEDDAAFAGILRDLAHEMGFQCIVAHSANDALTAAAEYRPSAILLDMNLPDHSGLGVLDQLKRNPATRHIPVHVASVADYSHEARELGAIGYAFKPVKREELVEAFQRLEAVFSQTLRRVLVVEDDARQRESLRHLLGSGEVEITAVASAGEALAQLKATTFDCVVMDFNLPDLSAHELLEQMAGEEEVSFPPVIVYTGRSLKPDEEQALRKFSRSIIVKGARSPERLLDEVTLFLHQVEAKLPAESQRMLKVARDRESVFEGRRILVVEDDVRNVFALSSVLEPKGARIEIARNGLEALAALERSKAAGGAPIDLVLMDIMMPEMDGFTAMREIRKRPEWKKLPIIALTAKAMKDDQDKCLDAGANDYIAKPLDVEKLLSLARVWMPK